MADSSFAKYCAGKGCNRVIEYQDGRKNRVIECICGFEFCFTCEHEFGHEPLQCQMLEQWSEERTVFKGEYMESTVVDISIPPPSFKPVSLPLSRISSLLKLPKQVFFLTQ